MRKVLMGCLIAALGLLMAMVEAAAQDLTGRWYGEGYQGRRYLHHLSERKASGEFSVEFREYDDCKLVAQHTERPLVNDGRNLHRSYSSGGWKAGALYRCL